MARTPSNMVELGTAAPKFSLVEPASGTEKSLDTLASDTATLIFFICNHCPFVHHIESTLVALVSEYQGKGVSCIGISSNDAEQYPQDGPEKMKERVEEKGYTFPYLYDKTQEVAKSYGAACTPDFFLFDKDLQLVYRGQFDDSRPDNGIAVSGSDLREALDAVLAGKSVPSEQKPSIGCNIKWRE